MNTADVKVAAEAPDWCATHRYSLHRTNADGHAICVACAPVELPQDTWAREAAERAAAAEACRLRFAALRQEADRQRRESNARALAIAKRIALAACLVGLIVGPCFAKQKSSDWTSSKTVRPHVGAVAR